MRKLFSLLITLLLLNLYTPISSVVINGEMKNKEDIPKTETIKQNGDDSLKESEFKPGSTVNSKQDDENSTENKDDANENANREQKENNEDIEAIKEKEKVEGSEENFKKELNDENNNKQIEKSKKNSNTKNKDNEKNKHNKSTDSNVDTKANSNDDNIKNEKEPLDTETNKQHKKAVFSNSPIVSEKTISKLGHINKKDVIVYQKLPSGDSDEKVLANSNKVYYIKKQANFKNQLYYLISREASSTQGVLGWVKSSDISTHDHKGMDGQSKTLYVAGNGNAYTKAWGGTGDLVYDLSNLKGEKIQVNKTESVGQNTWYRGYLNGKQVFIHSAYLITGTEKATSKLGHVKNSNVYVYQTVLDEFKNTKISTKEANKVYYIKKQTSFKNQLYYLISREASSTQGVLGWVKSSDISTHDHKGMDSQSKTLYVAGNGNAYTKAWGGTGDLVYDLSNLKGKKIQVNKTESVGQNTWYRGYLNGKQVFIHSAYLDTGLEKKTSKLGHLKDKNAIIYQSLLDKFKSKKAGSKLIDNVYYIKEEALFNKEQYYLISKKPSSSKGVIGWVKANDIRTHTHTGLDTKSKSFYIKGIGNAYSKAWGGNADLTYKLSNYKDRKFKVHKTEKVGNNTWYRGDLSGERIFIHESYLSTKIESTTSKLGHIKRKDAKIYENIGIPSTSQNAGDKYKDKVFYIKKEAEMNSVIYYLISEEPSSDKGVIGWVRSDDMRTHVHKGVDTQQKVLILNGKGNAYSKAWGGSKDLVYNLDAYAMADFAVDKTERVGNNTWYRGYLNGERVFIHEAYLETSHIQYEKLDVSLGKALNDQMEKLEDNHQAQQTDKYMNKPGYVHSDYVKKGTNGSISGNGVRLRTAPNFNDNIKYSVNKGTKIKVLGEVNGAEYKGSKKWYKISYKKSTLYVHNSLVSQGYYTTANVNVRASKGTSSHSYGILSKNSFVNIVRKSGNWYEIKYKAWRTPTKSDVQYYLNPNNNDTYQHLLLSSSVGVNAASLNKVLNNKGVLDGKAQSFIDAGRKHKVNEVYLISHAFLETSHGKSALATGTKVGKNSKGNPVLVTSNNEKKLTEIKTVYNMFGIGAYDGTAHSSGAKRAYVEGWDKPEKAIIGGAKFIGEQYIHNRYNQNTLYKMRWNTKNPSKQYATDIAWATKQVNTIKNLYELIDDPLLKFSIPKYK